MIGDIPEPRNFRYREVFLRGKPKHDKSDGFWARHPEMDTGKRAKLFAPFAALKGFDEAISKKEKASRDITCPHTLNYL